MKKIEKQPLAIPWGSHVSINLPVGSTILKVAVQEAEPHVWYEYPHTQGEEVEYEARTFVIRPSYRSWKEEQYNYNHIGTCLSPSGRLVYHIYEVLEK